MDGIIWNNPAVWWFVIGLVLIVSEFIIPGVVIIFFGIGAWIVSILMLMFDMPLNLQLMIFVVTSVAALILFRGRMYQNMTQTGESSIADRLEGFQGEIAVTETAFEPGKIGKVTLKGSSWEAWSDENIEAGERVEIIDKESIKLKIKRKGA